MEPTNKTGHSMIKPENTSELYEDVFLPLNSGVKYFLIKETGKEPEPIVWWNTNWNYRKEITIDHTNISSTLQIFRLLLQISDPDLKLKAQTDGDDIVLTDDNGIQLNHEIETYDRTTGESYRLGKHPSLSILP